MELEVSNVMDGADPMPELLLSLELLLSSRGDKSQVPIESTVDGVAIDLSALDTRGGVE
eukprot:CAMPEP_0174953956 /NCGR_PEP_ID=MMETSP0004_2-20121128/157_1 /TAXON_ID=420556 /ORGANISM="Ochromonas sp., Strain CCMP1393" /LENGTH=58 /DNA_ID=CAMNT_0016201717 /DNA_START=1331 /DNA_END=1507 /DNA_ORIENTATION=+